MHDLDKVSRSLSDGFESVGVPIACFICFLVHKRVSMVEDTGENQPTPIWAII